MKIFDENISACRGEFEGGRMVSASVGRVTEITVSEGERLGLPRLRSELSQQAQPVFSFDPSSETVLSSSPLLRDPYEDQVLAVRQSSVAGAGRGVFARADIRSAALSSMRCESFTPVIPVTTRWSATSTASAEPSLPCSSA